MKRVIEKTDDGSATLFVPELNEHYHSTKGARTESQHIFINMGLKASAAPSPHILEIGFGTGLNAWLTLEEAERSGRNVHYTGLELYPLEWQMVEQLGYIEQPAATDRFIHHRGKKKYPLPHTSLSAKYKPTSMNGLPSAAILHYPFSILHYPFSILHYHSTLSISTPSLRKSSRKCGRRNYLTVYMFY